jgi:hypothetical protein
MKNSVWQPSQHSKEKAEQRPILTGGAILKEKVTMLPSVTEADNGKILKVIGGALVAVVP